MESDSVTIPRSYFLIRLPRFASPRAPLITLYQNPKREDREAALLGCSNLEAQQAFAERAQTTASTNGVLE